MRHGELEKMQARYCILLLEVTSSQKAWLPADAHISEVEYFSTPVDGGLRVVYTRCAAEGIPFEEYEFFIGPEDKQVPSGFTLIGSFKLYDIPLSVAYRKISS